MKAATSHLRPQLFCVRAQLAFWVAESTACTSGMSTRCSLTNHTCSSLRRNTSLRIMSLVPSSPTADARLASVKTPLRNVFVTSGHLHVRQGQFRFVGALDEHPVVLFPLSAFLFPALSPLSAGSQTGNDLLGNAREHHNKLCSSSPIIILRSGKRECGRCLHEAFL